MKKPHKIILILLQIQIISLYALTPSNTEETLKLSSYENCKKIAQEKSERGLSEARKEYKLASESILNESKENLNKILWYVPSAYTASFKKILDMQKEKLKSLAEKINLEKMVLKMTWKAENALCEFNNKVITQKSTSTKK